MSWFHVSKSKDFKRIKHPLAQQTPKNSSQRAACPVRARKETDPNNFPSVMPVAAPLQRYTSDYPHSP